MQIDWLTVAAQIVNFLVLVWLLQRFLYRPITEAMARREDRIATRLAEAKDARAKVEAEAERLTDWLGGVRVLPRFPSPLFKEVAERPAKARARGR